MGTKANILYLQSGGWASIVKNSRKSRMLKLGPLMNNGRHAIHISTEQTQCIQEISLNFQLVQYDHIYIFMIPEVTVENFEYIIFKFVTHVVN